MSIQFAMHVCVCMYLFHDTALQITSTALLTCVYINELFLTHNHTRFPRSCSPVQVCKNPNMFSSPNLVVRLNGKYFTWMAACPIVMTMITFQKQLTEVSLSAKRSKGSLLIPALLFYSFSLCRMPSSN